MLENRISLKKEIDQIFDYALKNLESYQPWENYYRLRRKELQMVLHFFDIPKVRVMLELGCGIAFTSSLLSPYADTIIAADLPEPDIVTNARGMNEAIRLTNALKVKNIRLLSSSADNIPVKSGKADLVFSQYMLEHIPLHLRSEALKEMKRVLSDEGIIIALVPNFLDRIYNYPYHYVDLFVRLLVLFKETLLNKIDSERYKSGFKKWKEEKCKNESLVRKFRRLMFPRMHGNYQKHLDEITKQFPFVWERLFRENGLKIVKTFTIKHSPLATKSAISLYEKTAWLTKIIGGVSPFKYLGDSYCIIARKSYEAR